ncbi:FadR/GntR family transcriptional regulator [Nocardia sp. NPDC051981]|uniref:FadR/GntR family transcriptional regulator n=1 Tax=Nocardia sp. NPDC051981 TaxID=3155417 RepID=UPI00342C8A65
MSVRPVQHSSLATQASVELSRLITKGEWPVGSRLPNETELSLLLGVGRSTCREAVRALIASGQLQSRHGSGTYVLSATPVSEFDRQLRRSNVDEVYEVRLMLEVEAGRLAARRRTGRDLEELETALRQRESAADHTTFIEADLRFHTAVVAAAHNTVLTTVYSSLRDALRSTAEEVVETAVFGDSRSSQRDAKAHADLLAAIEAGDVRAAGTVARRQMTCALRAHSSRTA